MRDAGIHLRQLFAQAPPQKGAHATNESGKVFQADLASLVQYDADNNKGFRYFLLVVEVFTDYRIIGKRCALVAGSETATSARYKVPSDYVSAGIRHVLRRCTWCPFGRGEILVLRLRAPA